MSVTLKPYPEYKDSGVQWLGKVPAHWEVLPNRALFSEVKERNHPGEQMLSVTITKGVIRQQALLADSSKKDSSNEDKSAYKLVCPRDIAYNKMRAWQGAIGISDFRGIVSPAYVVVRLCNNQDPRYFHHLYRTPMFAKEAERWSYGITSDMWSLRPEHFKMIYTALPPLPEQSAIVRIIDHFDRQINRLIRAKRRLIELLKEQAYIIVLTGLEKVCIKQDSFWLDSLPNNWQKRKAKWLFEEVKTTNKPEKELLAVTQDRGILPKQLCEQNYVTPSGSLDGLKLVRIDDYVISLRSFQGGIEHSQYEGIVSPAYNILCLRDEYSYLEYKKYYKYLFKTPQFISLLNTIISGIRDGKNINFKDFAELLLLVPPREEIAGFIETFNRLESYQKRFAFEKSLLQEYRARLIADVVTGKLDVRGVELPALTEAEAVEDLDIPEETEAEGTGDTEEVADGDK